LLIGANDNCVAVSLSSRQMMKAALSKNEIESALAKRFGTFSPSREKFRQDTLSTGVKEIDLFSNGLPRGAITEVFGQRSSGRTSLLLAALSHATSHEEICALIDTSDRFDPASAAAASTELERLLWVCCKNDVERAFKATDLVLQSGGFGLIVLDMGDVAAQFARRIISSWWYRFRRAIEDTPAALMVISQAPCVRSCASLSLELKSSRPAWSNTKQNGLKANENNDREQLAKSPRRLFLVTDLPQHKSYNSLLTHSLVLQGADIQVGRRKPDASGRSARFKTHAAKLP
jgi:recA bacterial DNA recombination protein